MQERRLHTRFRVHVDVSYQSAVVAASAPAHDLSPGGVFVETTVPLPVGTRLSVRPLLDPAEGLGNPTFGGRVVRTVEHGTEVQAGSTPGMGVQFEVLTPVDRDVLMQIIRKHAPPDVAAALAPSAAAVAEPAISAGEAAEVLRDRDALAPAGAARDTLVDAERPTAPELAAAIRTYDEANGEPAGDGEADGGKRKGKKERRGRKRTEEIKK